MEIKEGDVWLVNFPLEENPTEFLSRPAIVINVEVLEVLSVKITKTEPRDEDQYDTPIVYWQEANLRFKSTARISKTMYINKSQFIHRIGTLHEDDFTEVQKLFIEFINNQ
jgi:mRNA-degrading endonuclease toxin of MazEF toxin-antitoxin module